MAHLSKNYTQSMLSTCKLFKIRPASRIFLSLIVSCSLFKFYFTYLHVPSRIFSYLHVSISKLWALICAYCIFSYLAENPWKHWLFCKPAFRLLTSLNAFWSLFIPQIFHKFMLEYGENYPQNTVSTFLARFVCTLKNAAKHW